MTEIYNNFNSNKNEYINNSTLDLIIEKNIINEKERINNELIDIKEFILSYKINNDTDCGYIDNPYIKFQSLTNNINDYYQNSYVISNYKKNSIWLSILLNVYKKSIDKHYTSIKLTYEYIHNIIDNKNSIKNENNSYSFNEVINFFKKFKLNLYMYDISFNLLAFYENEKTNSRINPKSLYVIFHNSYIYHVNHNINSFIQIKKNINTKNIKSLVYKNAEEYIDDINKKIEYKQKKDKDEIELKNRQIENFKKYEEEHFKKNHQCLKCKLKLTIENTPKSLYNGLFIYVCKKCNTLPVTKGILPYFKIDLINKLELKNCIPNLNNYLIEKIHNNIEYCNLAESKSEHGYMIEALIHTIIEEQFFNNYNSSFKSKMKYILEYNYNTDIKFNTVQEISDFIKKITYENYISSIKEFLIKLNNEYKIIDINKKYQNKDNISYEIDIICEKCLIDIKVVKDLSHIKKYWIQLIIYYCLINNKNIKRLGIYDHYRGNIYWLDTNEINIDEIYLEILQIKKSSVEHE